VTGFAVAALVGVALAWDGFFALLVMHILASGSLGRCYERTRWLCRGRGR
jgi:hypothetical protein